MALNIPSIADPRNPGVPVQNAYAWLSGLVLDMGSGAGRVTLTVNTTEANWQAHPITQLALSLGQGNVPTLPALMADPEFAEAFNALGAKLYALAVVYQPDLKGATVITPSTPSTPNTPSGETS